MKALLIGPGQLGRTLGAGLLACGVSVDVVRRGEPIVVQEAHAFVLVAVGEGDLTEVLDKLPAHACDKVVLLQNDLVPSSWTSCLRDPTVLVVWFEKKRKKAATPVRVSELFGPHAPLFASVFAELDLPAQVIDAEAGVEALVVKNLYITATNAMGVALGGGTTATLLASARDQTTALLHELYAIECARLGGAPITFARDAILERVFDAFAAEPTHGLLGRTAVARVRRAHARAVQAGVLAPQLEQLTQSIVAS